MGKLKTTIGVTALLAVLAMPPLAVAGTVVPPGNSAATQYTETFPTTSGNAEVNSAIGGGAGRGGNGPGDGGRTPDEVLGSRTARALEESGSEGRTVAALATAGAPETVGHAERPDGAKTASGGNGGKGGGPGASGHLSKGAGGAAGADSSTTASPGSSGLGEVVSTATGSTSGTMGIFFPLVLVLALAWAVAYVWRQHLRRPGQAAS